VSYYFVKQNNKVNGDETMGIINLLLKKLEVYLENHSSYLHPTLNIIRDDDGNILGQSITEENYMPAGCRLVSMNTYTKINGRRVVIRELKRM
jgi:hypothetical protein